MSICEKCGRGASCLCVDKRGVESEFNEEGGKYYYQHVAFNPAGEVCLDGYFNLDGLKLIITALEKEEARP